MNYKIQILTFSDLYDSYTGNDSLKNRQKSLPNCIVYRRFTNFAVILNTPAMKKSVKRFLKRCLEELGRNEMIEWGYTLKK